MEFAKLRCVVGLCQPVVPPPFSLQLAVTVVLTRTAPVAIVYLTCLDANTSFLCCMTILKKILVATAYRMWRYLFFLLQLDQKGSMLR